jgi:hypothetical protein
VTIWDLVFIGVVSSARPRFACIGAAAVKIISGWRFAPLANLICDPRHGGAPLQVLLKQR